MATRRMVREGFYSELETAASGLVDAASISQEYPNTDEELPAIVHDDRYREIPMNTNTGPVDIETDNLGVQAHIFSETMEAVFSVLVESDDEQEKEDIYEAVRSHFGEFKYPVKDVSDIHADAFTIDVTDADSVDTTERDPPARGDRLTISIGFERFYTKDTTPVETVNQAIDADDDGTDDINLTTT